MTKPAVYKIITSTGELYVYMNGALLYKRWVGGRSMLFEVYGPPTSNFDRDEGKYRSY